MKKKSSSFRTEHKGNLLFDKNKYLMRKLPQQQLFESDMAEELADFKTFQDFAFNSLLKERGKKNPNAINRNWNSNTMNGNVKENLVRHYPHQIFQDGSGRYFFQKDDKYIVFFKKLNDGLMPSNIPTKHSDRILKQIALPFEEPIPIVFIGYTINKTWDAITGHYAVCIHNGERKWVTDLTSLGGSSRLAIPANNPVTAPDVHVAVRGKKKAQ